MADQDFEIIFDERVLTALLIHGGAEVKKQIVKLGLEAALIAEAEMRRQIVMLLDKDPTGALARSVRREIVRQGPGELTVQVGPHTVYAAIQDVGGIVRPKKKFLAIPIPGAGVRKGKWPRDWGKGELHFQNRKGGSPLLFYGDKPVYVLKTFVRIKGVHYVDATVRASIDDVEAHLSAGLEELLEKVKAGARK